MTTMKTIVMVMVLAMAAREAAATGRFKVVHAIAAAGAPTVDVYTDDIALVEALAYGEESFYLRVEAGTYAVSVRAAGTATEIFTDNVTIAANADHTVIAHGDGQPGSPLALLTLTDDNSLPADVAEFHLRFVHASAGSPNVDVRADGAVVFANVAYGETGTPTYLNVPAGTLAVDAVLAGTSTVVVGPLDITFRANTVYTVVALGIVGDETTPLDVRLAQDQTGATANVRVVHAVAEGAPLVDVWVYGTPAVTAFEYFTATAYVALPAEKTYLEVTMHTDTDVIIGPVEVTLQPDTAYSVVAHGGNGAALDLLLLQDDNTAPAPGTAHLRFVHASAGSPNVDVWADDGVVFADVAYGQTGVPVYQPIAADGSIAYELAASVAGTDDPVVGPYKFVPADGQIVTVYAAGIVGSDAVPLDALALEDAPVPDTLDLSGAASAAVPSFALALTVAAAMALF